MKRLIAIDGNSLMHRAYYALPPMVTKDGTPTGAVYGFISMLLKLLSYEPDYLLVAFDMHGPTFRHEQYAEYKAGRRETPEDLRPQFPLLKKVLTAMGIAVYECERYEADDILGTFSRIANEKGVDALLVTGDRDALQLIGEHTHVLMTKKGITDTVEYDEAALTEQYGLTPARMPDLKGLMGDGSDNIPGIPGVGEKTALKLLKKYGSMEEVLHHAEEEKGALREKLIGYADLARMSYKLGVIDTAAPVDEGLEQCRLDVSKMKNAVPVMMELELRSLIGRLPAGKVPELSREAKRDVSSVRVADKNGLEKMMEDIAGAKHIAVHMGDGMQIAVQPDLQYEIMAGHTLLDAGLSAQEALLALKGTLEDSKVQKYMFDSKRHRHVLSQYGIELRGVNFDGMLADYLLHAIHPAPSLEILCTERGLTPGAAALLQIADGMEVEMREKGMDALYRNVELPLAGVLFDMEKTGFRVDREILKDLSGQFAKRLADLEKEIYGLCDGAFNILSPKQLGTVLFEKLKLPAQKKTKSGYSTDAEVLDKLMELHPVVPLIVGYRFLSKLKSTFLDAMFALIRADGKIHTSFNQNVTATGRISSAEPNLQNIPVRTELGREVRRAFIASAGCALVGADYSQIELRLLAHMSGDEVMIEAFRSGEDIHAHTAAEVFGVPQDQVTSAQRSAAKAVNFGIVYGISDFGLARNIGVSRHEAGEFIKRYLDRFAGVNRFMKECVEEGRRKGYAQTLLGRRRELPEITSPNYNTRSFGERVAMNMPIQGTAADIIKLAMVHVQSALLEGGYKAKLILQVHDELIIDTPLDEVGQVKEILLNCMQNAMELRVPLLAEVKSGRSWFDTK